jgi:hypothetical protein
MPSDLNTLMLAALGVLALVSAAAVAGVASARLLLRAARRADVERPRPAHRD